MKAKRRRRIRKDKRDKKERRQAVVPKGACQKGRKPKQALELFDSLTL